MIKPCYSLRKTLSLGLIHAQAWKHKVEIMNDVSSTKEGRIFSIVFVYNLNSIEAPTSAWTAAAKALKSL